MTTEKDCPCGNTDRHPSFDSETPRRFTSWRAEQPPARVAEAFAWFACVGIGVTLILNTHPAGDGMWFWYGMDLRHGAHLYRDLHLSLQPLFIVLTAMFQAMLGISWLASKVLPLLQLVVFSALFVRLARFVPWNGWQRALLAVGAFVLVLRPGTYRFDDYHVTSDIFTFAALLLLLHFGARPRKSARLFIACCGMGLSCGLELLTRPNDGLALGIAIGLALLLLYPRRGVVALAGVCLGALAAIGGILLLLHEKPATWWHWTFAAASAIKGGGGNILLSPLLLPEHLLLNLLSWKTLYAAFYVCLLWSAVRTLAKRFRAQSVKVWIASAAVWASLLVVAMAPLLYHSQVDMPLELTVRLASLLLICACIALTCWIALKPWVHGKRRSSAEDSLGSVPAAWVLLLFPLMHLLGGALTSANALPDLHLSLALTALLAPLCVPAFRARVWALPLLANLGLITAIILFGKVRQPYSWYTFNDGPIYRNRVWYHHPDYGPMYIERPQLQLGEELCRPVRADVAPQLLALPFPYPNYFCGVPPWRDYVQTWYDTSSAPVIHDLIAALQQAPPRWIAYQRDPVAMTAHEITYRHGAALPHRQLDALIVDQIYRGAWNIRVQQCFHGVQWLLIETAAAPPGLPWQDHCKSGK